jgi:hypothetical protein
MARFEAKLTANVSTLGQREIVNAAAGSVSTVAEVVRRFVPNSHEFGQEHFQLAAA